MRSSRMFFQAIALSGLTLLPRTGIRAEPVDFSHEIVPVLKKYCSDCHLGDKKKGGLSMNTRASLLKGSENGTVLELKKGASSYLIELLKSEDKDDQMPPKGDRVPAEKIDLLTRWIDEGAAWDEGFSFVDQTWEPPLKPRPVQVPKASSPGRDHPIDRIIDAYWSKKKITKPGGITDAEFMRRLYLDTIGLLPHPEELQTFLANPAPSKEKRIRLIDEVLGRDIDYAEHWLTFWNDLLRNDYAGTGYIDGGRKQITDWLYRSLVDNKRYDQFVRELIAPTGASEGFIRGIKWRGKVNASQRREIQFSQNISQVFLGINMKCASCHDSFIDRWKLEEAYGLGAVYATEPLEIHRCDKSTGKIAQAAWIFPELGRINPEAPQAERLGQLAKLMTDPRNGRFTRTIVNRIWCQFMGRGIVHPVDAMQTRPWNDDLLEWLANDFTSSGYDLKKLIRTIVTSRVYQSKSAATPVGGDAEAENFVFAGPIARRMTAEQFIDAIWTITGDAPTVPNAHVLRTKLKPEEVNKISIRAKWIWSTAAELPPENSRVAFRKQFDLKEKPALAQAAVTVDNKYIVFVNGKMDGSDENWETVESLSLGALLKKGKNEILVVATNRGRTPNPAGVFFDALVRFRGANGQFDPARDLRIVSDESWDWSRKIPNARGKYGKPVKDWSKAQPISKEAWSAKTGPAVRRALALALSDSGAPSPVRVSLVKCNLLMRALGRPNREQVVTVRPEELSTLQALNLANGDTMSEMLRRGAAHLVKNQAGIETPEKLIDWVYRFALSRPPTDGEQAVLTRIFHSKMETQQVEDFLWMVFMLPEFQLIQ